MFKSIRFQISQHINIIVVTWYSSRNCAKIALYLSKLWKSVWKGVKGVWVVLPLVFISFGNCSDMHLLVRISCLTKKCAQVRLCHETKKLKTMTLPLSFRHLNRLSYQKSESVYVPCRWTQRHITRWYASENIHTIFENLRGRSYGENEHSGRSKAS